MPVFARLNPATPRSASLKVRAAAVLLLLLLALFSGASFLLVSKRVNELRQDAQIINVAGRQRMSTQQIALLSWRLVLTHSAGERLDLRANLQGAIDAMASDHEQLIDARSPLYPDGTRSEDLKELYFGNSALDRQVRAFLAAGQRLQAADDRQLNLLNPDLIELEGSAQGSLMPALDAIVTIESLHARDRRAQLDLVALISLLGTLVTLSVVGIGILFPLLRRVDQTLADLQREHQFGRQVMDSMGQGLGITGPDHRYRYVNPAYARMVGRTQAEMIGMISLEMVPAEQHAGLLEARRERRVGRTSRQNLTFTRPDGTTVQTLTVVVPYSNEAGAGGIAVVTDMTERIQAEQQLRHRDHLYRTMASNFPDGTLMLFDRSLQYTLADGAGLAAVGLSAERLEGHTPDEVYPPEIARKIEAMYRLALAGETTEQELEVGQRTYTVRTLPVISEAQPAGTGHPEVVGGMSITQDITVSRRAARDLMRAGTYTAALLEVSRLVQSEHAPAEVALRAARVVGRAADVDWGSVVVKEPGGLRTVACWPVEPSSGTPAAFALGVGAELTRAGGPAWEAIQEDRAVFADDCSSQLEVYSALVGLGVRSAVFLPLGGSGAEKFLFVAMRLGEARAWSSEDQALFQAAARSVQTSLERHTHLQELERAALVDALTGLGNRRAFESDLERELDRTRRSGEEVGVLMVDLDGLKQINDLEGHERGDALLVSFAQTLTSSLRGEDRVYRLGGDEYAAILIRAGFSSREALAARVRQAVIQTRMAGFHDIDASAGLAFSPPDERRAGDLLRLADERMYVQKQEHRLARRSGAVGTGGIAPINDSSVLLQ